MNNSKAKYMLRESVKLNNEYYKLDIIVCLIETFNTIIKVGIVEVQEELKAKFIKTLETIYPNIKLNAFVEYKEISEMLMLLYNGQKDVIENLKKENRENEKTSVYKVVANISISIGMKLNVKDLSVAEFIEYYKIAEENGR